MSTLFILFDFPLVKVPHNEPSEVSPISDPFTFKLGVLAKVGDYGPYLAPSAIDFLHRRMYRC